MDCTNKKNNISDFTSDRKQETSIHETSLLQMSVYQYFYLAHTVCIDAHQIAQLQSGN